MSANAAGVRRFMSMPATTSQLVDAAGLIIHTHGDSDGKTWTLQNGRLTLFSSIPIGVVSINDLHTVKQLSEMFINFCQKNIKSDISNEDFTKAVQDFQYNYVSYYVTYFIPEIFKLLLDNKINLDLMYAKKKAAKADIANKAEKIQYLIDLTRLVDIIQNHPELLMVCRVYNSGDTVLTKTFSSNQKLLAEANKEFAGTTEINTNWQVTIVPDLHIMSTSLVPLKPLKEEKQTTNLKAEPTAPASGKGVKASGKKGVTAPETPVDKVVVTARYVHTLPGVDGKSTASGFEAPNIIIDQYAKKIADRTTTAHHISFTNEELFTYFLLYIRFLCVMDNSCLEIKMNEQLVTDWDAIIAMREDERKYSPAAYRMSPENIQSIKAMVKGIKFPYGSTEYTVAKIMTEILSNTNYGQQICDSSGMCLRPDAPVEAVKAADLVGTEARAEAADLVENPDVVAANEDPDVVAANEDPDVVAAPMVAANEDPDVVEAPMVAANEDPDVVAAPMVVEATEADVAAARKRKLENPEGGRRKRNSKKQKGSKRSKRGKRENTKFRKTYKKRRHRRKTKKR